MLQLRWLAASIGMVALLSGAASAADEPPVKVVEPAEKVNQPMVPSDASCDSAAESCQSPKFTPTCFGRIVHWMMYRPCCDGTPCETACAPTRYPPLIAYFTCSPYYKCYKPYTGEDCRAPWFTGWCGRKCRTCVRDKGCRDVKEPKSPLVISVTFPAIHIARTRDCTEPCDSCPTAKVDRPKLFTAKCDPCSTCTTKADCDGPPLCAANDVSCVPCPPTKERCRILPRSMFGKLCGTSASKCDDGECKTETGRSQLINGRMLGCFKQWCGVGSCGSCGYGKKCCCGPVPSPVDAEHMPIIQPQSVKDTKVGNLVIFRPVSATTPAATTAEPLFVPVKK